MMGYRHGADVDTRALYLVSPKDCLSNVAVYILSPYFAPAAMQLSATTYLIA
jgi:hypothetical protein